MSSTEVDFDQFLKDLEAQTLPPVHSWHPASIRDMDLLIDRHGDWYYQGGVFQRHSLVKLLSGILVKEQENYFLKSPSETLRITVEDVPFVVTDFSVSTEAESKFIIFDTNVDYKVPLDQDHPLLLRPGLNGTRDIPYILVRDNLEGRIARSAFYRLIDYGEYRMVDGAYQYGLVSHGQFFSLGDVTW